MSAVMNGFARGVRVVGAVSPRLAGCLVNVAFFSTRGRMGVRDGDRATHDAARREVVRVRGRDVVTYQWGSGSRTALLMHGWNGRASQFATLVRDLVGEGFRVVSFDAPAHGESPRSRTDARDWVATARLLNDAKGPFDLVVGHSFGAFAALAAVRHGVVTPRVVTIAGAGDVGAFHGEFERMMRLAPPVRLAFEAAFYRSLGMTRDEAADYLDSIANPLPEHVEVLIVHDRHDRVLGSTNSERLHAAHDTRSHLFLTSALDHNRILGADEVLDAVLEFANGGLRSFSLQDVGGQI